MAYEYDQILAADPSNPERVASQGVVTIFAPGDTTRTPLTITTLDGLPLGNPIKVNEQGYGPAFAHATLDQVAWAGGGFSGLFVSYKGMKAEAVAARDEAITARAAAVQAASTAGEAATALLEQKIAEGEFKGTPGMPGPNSIPTLEFVAKAVKDALDQFSVQEILGQYELQKYVGEGDSWSAFDRANITTGASPVERLAKRLGTTPPVDRGFSSRTVEDLANINLGGVNGWVPRTKALVTITSCHLNNTKYLGTGPAAERGYKHAWRALLSTLTADAATPSNTAAFTYSPGWTAEATTGSTTAQASNNSTGGKRFRTTTTGAYSLVSATGPSVDVFAVARKAGAGVMTVSNNTTGAVLGTLDLSGTVAQETPAVLKLRSLGSGTRTLRITHTSGASLTLDSVRIPTANPVPIVLAPAPNVQEGGGNTLPSGDPSPSYNAAQATERRWMSEVAAEYPSVSVCDLNTYAFEKVADFYSDLRHLNDRGAAKWAASVMEHLKTRGYTQGLNMVGNDSTQYAPPPKPAVPTGGQDGAGNGDTPEGSGVIEDNFARADTITGLGAPWIETRGAWGIAGGEAYRVTGSGTQGSAVIDSGFTDGTIETKLTVIDATYSGGLTFRASEATTVDDAYVISLRQAAGLFRYTLFKRVGGVNTILEATLVTPQAGDILHVTMNGPDFALRINGELKLQHTDSTHTSNTRHGLYLNSAQGPATTRFDYIKLTPA